ncbi:hypothetical protein AcV5_003096 [Taiwanofungus camphoratus]|nr:hypothetical protein AcV5_003096 [Antrodia cinnamomea]
MGKLNIAHHKSYHPYRRDNIERVRRDEEEARQQDAVQEGRMMLADSEARIDLLRQRAGAHSAYSRHDDDDHGLPQAGLSSISLGGHINLFEDLERQSMPIQVRSGKKSSPPETEKGIPLAPSAKDLKPWYSDRNPEKSRELDEDRKLRDLARKSVNDPLTSINHQLASRASGASRTPRVRPALPPSSGSPAERGPPEMARLSRESSERRRALELIQRKRREVAGSETPSTVRGDMDGGYGDVFNRREVEEARRYRERRWDRDSRYGGGSVKARW